MTIGEILFENRHPLVRSSYRELDPAIWGDNVYCAHINVPKDNEGLDIGRALATKLEALGMECETEMFSDSCSYRFQVYISPK